MKRSSQSEILDSGTASAAAVARSHRDLNRINNTLGNTRAIISKIKQDPLPVRRVLDIGCGGGGVAAEIGRRLHVEVIGIDRKPPEEIASGIRVIAADAVHDKLPDADMAYSVLVAHHLSADDLAAMIANVLRSCRRFILLDLVRHPLPLFLFNAFVAPFVSPVTAYDGRISVRRAFTPGELRRIVQSAAATAGATFDHSVAPCYVRQVADIRTKP